MNQQLFDIDNFSSIQIKEVDYSVSFLYFLYALRDHSLYFKHCGD